MSQELLDKAKSLGVSAVGLNEAQLKKAIAAAEVKAKEVAEASKILRDRATALGIELADKSDDSIASEVNQIEEKLQSDKEAEIFYKKAILIAEFLEIKNFEDLSQEELEVILSTKKVQDLEVEKVAEGKTDQSFTVDGTDYKFADDAPEAFRYLGQLRTQKEWLEDADSLELLVSAKLPYIIKK